MYRLQGRLWDSPVHMGTDPGQESAGAQAEWAVKWMLAGSKVTAPPFLKRWTCLFSS